jgi:hypothetical protein
MKISGTRQHEKRSSSQSTIYLDAMILVERQKLRRKKAKAARAPGRPLNRVKEKLRYYLMK